jgi:hypothetical protein
MSLIGNALLIGARPVLEIAAETIGIGTPSGAQFWSSTNWLRTSASRCFSAQPSDSQTRRGVKWSHKDDQKYKSV